MKVHSDIIIYQLLKLNFYLTDSTSINIGILKNAFYEILDIIEINDSLKLSYNFENELEKFLELYQEFITIDDDTITLDITISDFLSYILKAHNNKLSEKDYKISDYVLNPKICLTLGLSIPFDVSKEYVYLNSLIIQRYLKLGEKEFHNLPLSKEDFENLTLAIKKLYDLFNDIDNSDLTKLKICINCFNEQFLSSKNERFINSPWNTILFSYNPQRFQSLRYDLVEYLTSIIDEIEDDENKELLDSLMSDIEAEEILDELSLFLTYFFIYLNNYLKIHPATPAREALIIKKYLLLSTPELKALEKYFLKNHTLDSYVLPESNNDSLTETTFEELKEKVISCTINLNIDDTQAINYPHLYAKLVTCALFIKTFLTLSINENSKSDIIDLITNSIFYKQSNYKIATSIVDNIIFSDNLNLTK